MTRRLLALLVLLAGCGGPEILERPSLPEADRPAGSRHHRFRVRATAVPTRIRRDLTLKEIGRLPGAVGSPLKTQGITLIKHSLATHTRFSSVKGTKEVYAWFDDVILEVEISSDIIHIPKEYPAGSCEHDIVLEHERGHGRVARETAVAFAAKLERALMAAEGLPTRFDPVISSDFDAAAEKLKAAIAKIVDPVYDRYEQDERDAQARLDRPDPYDAVYRKCAGWK